MTLCAHCFTSATFLSSLFICSQVCPDCLGWHSFSSCSVCLTFNAEHSASSFCDSAACHSCDSCNCFQWFYFIDSYVCGVCVCVCAHAHVEVREHLEGVSSLFIPCSILWIELKLSGLGRKCFTTEHSHQPDLNLKQTLAFHCRGTALSPW